MKLNWNIVLILSLSLIVFTPILLENSFAQTRQDLTCSACITISNTKELDIHKNLNLPIILWASNFDYTYDHNSVITISGHSNLNNPETPITISVTDPIGNLITVQQLMVDKNSDFQIKFNTNGPLWKKDGMYVIKAQGGPTSTVFKTNVEVISTGIGSKVECKTKEITVIADNGGKYCVPYSTTGETKGIETASLNTKTKTLKIEVRSLDIQNFVLNIDKTLLDSKTPKGAANPFNILVNGKAVKFDELESKLPNYRTLSIPIQRDTNVIEIVGTHVIPEFGTLAVLILVVAIISVVVISSKRLQPLNQFQKF